MKKLLFLLLSIIGFISAISQNVSIPDANFRNYLLSTSWINTDGDDNISVEEAQAFDGGIFVSNMNISSLTGIEAFINIDFLYCDGNNIHNLNLSNNTLLESINCKNNPLVTLNISNCTILYNLEMSNTSVNNISINSSVFNTLWAQNTLLHSLDLSGKTQLTWVDCEGSSALHSIDVTGCVALEYLDLQKCSLSEGLLLQSLYNLTYVDISETEITSFYAFNLPLLETLWATYNFNMPEITLNSCPALTEFYCYTGEIENIIIVACPAIQYFNCSTNQLTHLNNVNFAAIPALLEFTCYENKIEGTLNFSSNNQLKYLYCNDNFGITGLLLPSSVQYVDCNANFITALDCSMATNLKRLNCSFNDIYLLNVSTCNQMTELYCNDNKLQALNINNCTALTKLHCFKNQISSLNATSNPALTELRCNDNLLEYLTVAGASINTIECQNNKIRSLNITDVPDLSKLFCNNNRLSTLDMRNGNYEILSALNFDATNNLLTCVSVDDVEWANNHWFSCIDNEAEFNTFCYFGPEIVVKQNTTEIPVNGTFFVGTVNVGSSSSEITFTIENTGDQNLLLTGTPKIVVSDADAARFTIHETSTNETVIPSGNTTFSITYIPLESGTDEATISIANNDGDENPFIFAVQGAGFITNQTNGSAFNFTGNETIDIPISTTPFSTNATWEFWVYLDNMSNQCFINHASDFNGNGYYINLSDSKLYFTQGTGGKGFIQSFSTNNAVQANSWSHIAIVKNGSQVTLYVNGADKTEFHGNHSNIVTNSGLRIGEKTGFGQYIFGKMDELRLWSKALTLDEIKENIYNELSNPATISDLEGYYTFNESSGTVLPDWSGNHYDGNVNNASNNEWWETYAMVVPAPQPATVVTPVSFTANWLAPQQGIVEKYLLDVSTNSNFSTVIPGYNAKNCGTNSSETITGLTPNTTYYYRVKAFKTSMGYSQFHYHSPLSAATTTPEIHIKQNYLYVASDSTFDFGTTGLQTSLPKTFTIKNLGTNDLHLTDTPKILLSGTDAQYFSINETATLGTIEPSSSTEFTVIYNPIVVGSHSAVINISNNDTDENPYIINLKGNSAVMYLISTSVNPANSGTITGSGYYEQGQTVTLTATPETGYSFVNWTENGTEVTTNAIYGFIATADRTLVANFTINAYSISAGVSPENTGTVAGMGTFEYGTTVNLEAQANTGYSFSYWTEDYDIVSTQAHYSFPATADRILVANFAVSIYSISVSVNPLNAATVTGAGNYLHGSSVTLVALSNNNYSFDNWTENGNVLSTNENYSFTATANRSIVANFSQILYTISATVSPENTGTVLGTGVFTYGYWVSLEAVPNDDYAFSHWTIDGETVSTNSPLSFTVYENLALVAHFVSDQCNVSVTINPENAGTVSGLGTGIFTYGETVTLDATPNENFVFIKWTEDGQTVSWEATYSFTAIRNYNLVAEFNSDICTLTLNVSPENAGTVTGAGSYPIGTEVTITATANDGYSFLYWTYLDYPIIMQPSFSFPINNSYTFTAVFTPNSYSISATVNPENSGTITGTGNYNHGQNVTMTAFAENGYFFDNWTENGTIVSTNANYEFIANSNRTLVANFELNPLINTNLNLTNLIVENNQTNCYNALQTINVAGNGTSFIVLGGGSATFIAGQNIRFLPGTVVMNQGTIHGYITTTGNYCGTMAPAMVVNPLGTEENSLVSPETSFFKVFPNPTSGKINIEFTNDFGSADVLIRIYNLMGERVFKEEIPGFITREISLEHIPKGLYLISISQGDKSGIRKIIRQ